jgi:hypothetical protein
MTDVQSDVKESMPILRKSSTILYVEIFAYWMETGESLVTSLVSLSGYL